MSDLQFANRCASKKKKTNGRNGHQNNSIHNIYARFHLNLLPKSPSQSPLLDSGAGSLGVCTHSLGGMIPSSADRGTFDGLGRTGVNIARGDSLCVGSCRNASFVYIAVVVVVAVAAAVVAAADVAVDVDAHDVAGVAVAHVAY
jgi:hypothetical protein